MIDRREPTAIPVPVAPKKVVQEELGWSDDKDQICRERQKKEEEHARQQAEMMAADPFRYTQGIWTPYINGTLHSLKKDHAMLVHKLNQVVNDPEAEGWYNQERFWAILKALSTNVGILNLLIIDS